MKFHLNTYLLVLGVIAVITKPVCAKKSPDDNKLNNKNSVTKRVSFDPLFLQTSGNTLVNLERFENGDSVLPGIWPSEIYVNDDKVSYEPVLFSELSDGSVQPCLTPNTLKKMSFDYSKLPNNFVRELKRKLECYPLSTIIPQANYEYDSSIQRLNIIVPQIMIMNTARGYVSPELWDSGIPAFLLGYDITSYSSRSNGQTYNSAYAGVNAGLNLGAWYFRHDGNYDWREKSGSNYQSLNNYVQRDIPKLKGRVLIGETSTQGHLFDTVPFKGIELVNDERMLPQSQRGYAPDIRGIARTNARVTVRQNSRVIYETTVSPGPFLINDLYPTGYGGDLEVVVTEADGSIRTFSVPYASVTPLLRPGMHNYDIVFGKLNDPSLSFNPSLYQAIYQRGLTNIVTGYGGIQGSGSDYYALQGGLAISTVLGAFSLSATQARTHLYNDSNFKQRQSGQSYQISYSKFIPETNSNLTIAAYRFSTSGFYDLTTAMRAIDEERNGRSSDNVWRPRNRFNITVNQGLKDSWGQIFLTGYTQDYWNEHGSDIQFQLGYSNSWGDISYSLSAGRVRTYGGDKETSLLLNMTVPLGRNVNNTQTLTTSLSHSTNGQTGEQVGLSGNAGSDNQYNYGVTAMNYNNGVGSSSVINGGWRTPYTNLTASYGSGNNYHNTSLGVSGTVIAWSDGIVATPYSGDTFAIVEAQGAEGAKLGGYSGLRIDPFGHAAVPYLNPYEVNEISIDPKGLPSDVELENTSEKVIPYTGSVSHVTFKTKKGIPILIMSKTSKNEDIPFGAEVYDQRNNLVGNVGQNGQIYSRVQEVRGELKVKWGKKSGQSCSIAYVLPPLPKNAINSFIRFDSICEVR